MKGFIVTVFAGDGRRLRYRICAKSIGVVAASTWRYDRVRIRRII